MKHTQNYLLPLTLVFSLALLSFTFIQDRPSPAREASGSIGTTDVIVTYSSPSVNDRTIWGELVPYNQVWCTGANEATTVEFKSDVMIQGQTLPAGKYSLFTIPKENSEWIVIFNKVDKQWGSFDYDQSEDVMRIMAKPADSEFNERLKFEVNAMNDQEGQLVMYWDKIMLPIAVKSMK
jgi:hypothetical protein